MGSEGPRASPVTQGDWVRSTMLCVVDKLAASTLSWTATTVFSFSRKFHQASSSEVDNIESITRMLVQVRRGVEIALCWTRPHTGDDTLTAGGSDWQTRWARCLLRFCRSPHDHSASELKTSPCSSPSDGHCATPPSSSISSASLYCCQDRQLGSTAHPRDMRLPLLWRVFIIKSSMHLRPARWRLISCSEECIYLKPPTRSRGTYHWVHLGWLFF